MGITEIIKDLQKKQSAHDIKAHKDIYYLSTIDRIKHLSFHISKYCGYLSRIREVNDKYHNIIIDIFIITLSLAEVLEISLIRLLASHFDETEYLGLNELGNFLSKRLDVQNINEYYFYELVYISGRIAKGCESIDHLEEFPYRKNFSEAIFDLFTSTLIIASFLKLDLADRTEKRWIEIEQSKNLSN